MDFNHVCSGIVSERSRTPVLSAFRDANSLSHDWEILLRFRRFITAWNAGEELLMNSALRDYSPYQAFLFDLKHLNFFNPEQVQSPKMKMLQKWAMALGEAYRCPFGTGLYYGGAPIELADFEDACKWHYDKALKTSGFANLTDLAHSVCLERSLSWQAFRRLWLKLIQDAKGKWRIAPATIRRSTQRTPLKLCRLYPRQRVNKKRLEAKLLGKTDSPEYFDWFWKQDGIPLGTIQAKLVKRYDT